MSNTSNSNADLLGDAPPVPPKSPQPGPELLALLREAEQVRADIERLTGVNELVVAPIVAPGSLTTTDLQALATAPVPELTVGKPEIDFTVRKRQYIPCTGAQISAFLKAARHGMKDAHYAAEAEVDAYVLAHGL
jgi:hypothetical protein